MDMSFKQACERFKVSPWECRKAGVPTFWKSGYGNSWEAVYISDMERYMKKLEAKTMKEKLGEKEFKKWEEQQNKKDRLEYLVRKHRPAIGGILREMMDVNASDPTVEIEGVKISTGIAKKFWGCTDFELDMVGESEKQGRATVYNLVDVIEASLESRQCPRNYKDRQQYLSCRLKSQDDMKSKNQYAAYLRRKLELYDPDVVSEVTKRYAKCAKEKVKMAEKELQEKKCHVELLVYLSSKGSMEEEEASTDEENDVDSKPQVTQATAKEDNQQDRPKYALKTTIWKKFLGYDELFEGTITSYNSDSGFYHIQYKDGDEEDLTERQVAACTKNMSKKRSAIKAMAPTQVSPTPRKRRSVEKASYKEESEEEISDDEDYC